MKRLTWLFAAVLACLAVAAAGAEETGTRVVIQMSKMIAMPDPEKVVEQLVALGGKHEVRVLRSESEQQHELTIDLWGSTLESKDIAPTLRHAFPSLVSATIDVSTAPASDKPQVDESELQDKGQVKIIKKSERRKLGVRE